MPNTRTYPSCQMVSVCFLVMWYAAIFLYHPLESLSLNTRSLFSIETFWNTYHSVLDFLAISTLLMFLLDLFSSLRIKKPLNLLTIISFVLLIIPLYFVYIGIQDQITLQRIAKSQITPIYVGKNRD